MILPPISKSCQNSPYDHFFTLLLSPIFLSWTSRPETDRQDEHDVSVDSFLIHRKLLRRRHVRKLQKIKEREQQRQKEERKLKELTIDRDRKRRAEKTRALRDNEKASNANSRAKHTVYSVGINESSVHEGYFIKGTKKNRNNPASYCISSPTSVMGLHRMFASTPTLSSPHPVVTGYATAYNENEYRCRLSFSLPEFTPVRPTKFRKLQLWWDAFSSSILVSLAYAAVLFPLLMEVIFSHYLHSIKQSTDILLNVAVLKASNTTMRRPDLNTKGI